MAASAANAPRHICSLNTTTSGPFGSVSSRVKVLPRIGEGRVNGFYKDVVLLEQASVQDPKKTVKNIADEAGLTVNDFVPT